MEKIALIFAGGIGQRMGGEIPKQFLKVGGKEIIIHTIEKFELNDNIDKIYIICIENWIPYLTERIKKYNIKKVFDIVPGGVTGQDSIFIGLSKIKENNDNSIVLIHDGVRPLITDDTINNCIRNVEKYGSAVTVTPCCETPIISNDYEYIEKIEDREKVFIAQAPQGFYLNEIYDLHIKERCLNPNYVGIIDSATLFTKYGNKAKIFVGNIGNIKVTTPSDFCTLIGNFAAFDYGEYLKLPKDNNL